MEWTTTMTRAGQITIPKALREFLNVRPGQKIALVRGKDAVSIARKMTVAEAFAAMDKVAVGEEVEAKIRKYRGLSARELREQLEESAEGRAELKERHGT